jgi:transcriptional regulator with XRE-family HTH domain
VVTKGQFLEWLRKRRAAGETTAAIGDSLGVSGTSVTFWLQNRRNPSSMVLTLAEHLFVSPVELPAGLPEPQESFSGASSRVVVDPPKVVRRVKEGER